MIRHVVWCPSKGGHLRYSTNLVAAIERNDEAQAIAPIAPGVLTTSPLGPLYQSTPYPIECVGEEIRDRRTFPSTFHWALDRIGHHIGLERELVRWLRTHPDCRLVHLQEIHEVSGPRTARSIRGLGRKVVYTMHNVLPHRRGNRLVSALQRRWTRRLLKQVDAVIVHSESLKKACIERYGIDSARVHVIPHGMSLPHSDSQATQATADGGRTRPVRLLCYGTLRPNKGFHHLLDAMEAAPAHWEVVIAGFPSDPQYARAELEPRMARLRSQGRTIDYRPGYVAEDEVATLFASADALALPYENFDAQSGVLLDAMAHRIRVFATESGALGETIRSLGFGIVTRSLDPADLRVAISETLALDEATLAKAWQKADEQYSWDSVARQTTTLYRDLG